MESRVQIIEYAPGIYLAERSLDTELEGGTGVRSILLLGDRLTIVVDTLLRPADMQPFVALAQARGRPVCVVNSHADWDHAWGNGAFPGSLIIGQRHCRERLVDEAPATLAEKLASSPGFFDDVVLVPPEITFDSRLNLHTGDLSIELHHLPGHTTDSLVVYLPERGLLFAADCAEWPIPLLNSGPALPWAAALRSWAARPGLQIVIPSHGPISDPALLLANAAYLEQIVHTPSMSWELPPGADKWYAESAHPDNLIAARRETASG